MNRLFGLLVIALILVNTYQLTEDTFLLKKRHPFEFYGILFTGLDDTLKGVQYVGYYTDSDIDNAAVAAQFSQAQYTLAPVILDLNNTTHEFTLFNCSSEEAAFKKIKEIQAIPYKKNPFGIILAKKSL